jgi:hypothetical protein
MVLVKFLTCLKCYTVRASRSGVMMVGVLGGKFRKELLIESGFLI